MNSLLLTAVTDAAEVTSRTTLTAVATPPDTIPAAGVRLDQQPVDTVQGDIHAVLDQMLAQEDIQEWHSPENSERDSLQNNGDVLSLMVFRVADSWLALPANVLDCITTSPPTHRLPSARHPAILGIVNLRGMVTIKLSLPILLGLDGNTVHVNSQPHAERMALAIALGNDITLFESEQVFGMVKIAASATKPVSRPGKSGAGTQHIADRAEKTLASSTMQAYTKSVFYFTHGAVGILDTERLRQTFERHLS